MYLNAVIEGEKVFRPYTPVTSDDELGYFELVIKVREKVLSYLLPCDIEQEKRLLISYPDFCLALVW